MDHLFFPPLSPPNLPAQASALRRSLGVAAVLMRHRSVDLSGFEDEVGRLCAGLLDLPAAEAVSLRLELSTLLAAVNTMLAGSAARPRATS